MTYFSLIKRSRQIIQAHGLDPYVANYLLCRRLHWDTTKLLMHNRVIVSERVLTQFRADLSEYLAGQPPQYIIGTAAFFGYNFVVNKNVLIPRPETEELVQWILKDNSAKPLKVLDIGTGSGAIAIALKLQRPNWQVSASDISVAALKVAQKNAALHHVKINFYHSDLLKTLPKNKYDVIVSNPPYVARNEIKFMDTDVIKCEPHQALFAAHHGLAIYQRLAQTFQPFLAPQGSLYLEIGFHQADAVQQIFKRSGSNFYITIKRDLARHQRMVKVRGA